MKWSDDRIDQFKSLYPDYPNSELAKRFACSVSCIKNKAQWFKLKKNIPNSGHFSKGYKPPNKGKTMTGQRSKTCYKKGHKPSNRAVIGMVVNTNDGYRKIKIFASRWELLHRYIWKQNHPGEIIAGSEMITFADGDRNNLSPDNLVKITRAQNVIRNRFRDRDVKLWTQAETKFLVKNYHILSNREIGSRLNRTVQEVITRAKNTGLKKQYIWTPGQDALLERLYPDTSLSLEEIAKRVNRSVIAIRRRAKIFGLTRSKDVKRATSRRKRTEKVSKVRTMPVSKDLTVPEVRIKPVLKAPTVVRDLKLDEKKIAKETATQQLEIVKNREQDKIAVRIDRSTVIMISRDADRDEAVRRYVEKKNKAEKKRQELNEFEIK